MLESPGPFGPNATIYIQLHLFHLLNLLHIPIDNTATSSQDNLQPQPPDFIAQKQDTQLPLQPAVKAANLDQFSPFDIEFYHPCYILDDTQFEKLLQLAHSGLIGAIWSAPPCKLYSQLRKDEGGPPPLRTEECLDGLPCLTPHQLLGARIQGNSSQSIYFMYPSIPNKEALQLKNSPSILSPGVNHSTNSFLHNARAVLVLHQLANGVSIGAKPRLLQLHQTKSNLWQVNVLTTSRKMIP